MSALCVLNFSTSYCQWRNFYVLCLKWMLFFLVFFKIRAKWWVKSSVTSLWFWRTETWYVSCFINVHNRWDFITQLHSTNFSMHRKKWKYTISNFDPRKLSEQMTGFFFFFSCQFDWRSLTLNSCGGHSVFGVLKCSFLKLKSQNSLKAVSVWFSPPSFTTLMSTCEPGVFFPL